MKTAREWAEELLRIGSARDGWTVVVCEEIDGYAETTADADEIAGRIRHKIAAVIEKAVLAERARRGLDPTVVDADPEAQARGRAYLDAELARIAEPDPGPYVCPGCYAVDAACEPGCPDAEAEDEREDEQERERLDREHSGDDGEVFP
jgi:hypothetical protein